MTLLSWRNEYRVGVPMIDKEHEYLIGLINEFHDRYAGGATLPQALRVLNKLVSYAERHFRHEESLMAETGYPRLDNQRRLHEELFTSIFTLHEELCASKVQVDSRTMRFLRHWLLDHIIEEDMDIGDFMRRKAAQSEKAAKDAKREEAQGQEAAEVPGDA